MKHRGFIAIVFVIGCATGGVAAQLVVPPVRAGTSPTRWEYQCVESRAEGSDVTSTLNQLGLQGWELASMGTRYTFGSDRQEVQKYVVCAKRALP